MKDIRQTDISYSPSINLNKTDYVLRRMSLTNKPLSFECEYKLMDFVADNVRREIIEGVRGDVKKLTEEKREIVHGVIIENLYYEVGSVIMDIEEETNKHAGHEIDRVIEGKLPQNTAGTTALKLQVAKDPDNTQARFDLALCLFAEYDVEQGLEMLFFIQQHHSDFKDGAAREMIGLICNMLTSTNPEASSAYRQRLANLIND